MRSNPEFIPRSLARLFRQWGLIAVADPQELVSQQGLYLLLLTVPARSIKVGALGSLPFVAGLYAYVGSACGRSVTLSRRLTRHMCRRKVRRWHIDYLTTAPAVTVRGAYWSMDRRMTETRLAICCAQRFSFIPRFGNGDSPGGAPGHLFLIRPDRPMTSVR